MRVAFITGIGGQGKSALAGQLLRRQAMAEDGRFDIWDWRDCREQSERLITQLLRLVGRLGDGKIDTSQIEVTNLRAVIGVLFRVLQDRAALLVFDNVDQYIDLQTLQPIKGLDLLLSEAQTRNHRSCFVFTCRPDVRVDEVRALRIPLSGITEDQTRQLVETSGVPANDYGLSGRLHQRTEGHPFWIRLSTLQAARSNNGLRGVLELIESGNAKLPDTARSIWNELSEPQRGVLRTMAELDRPESESRLLDILPGRNSNRITRALRALQSFHLIEARALPGGGFFLGLHPIIREFVRTNFSEKDREPYILQVLNYFDNRIVRFKDLIEREPSFEILENWTRAADLQINIGHFEEAISIILEIADSLISRGYTEEFLRITIRLFGRLNWAEACLSFKDFDRVYRRCLRSMIDIKHDATDRFLDRYEESIPGRSAQFILLCELRCYSDWFLGKFASAIRWGEEAERLKHDTSVDTIYSARHSLSLALRDAGRINDALEILLEDESLDIVLKKGHLIKGKTETFYGNIGRCLYLKTQRSDALVCYIKSGKLLEEDRSHEARVNKGYIRQWIGELLAGRGEYGLASASYRAAELMWDDSSPPRALTVRRELDELVEKHPDLAGYLSKSAWKVEEEYRRWLRRQ